ncbi:MAG: alkaline phosphatase family protein, partial [Candidatus Cybelea sp.]
MTSRAFLALAFAVATALLAGCQSGPSFAPARSAQTICHPERSITTCHPERSAAGAKSRGEGRRTASPIKHVVFVVQENRSFNNLFLGFPGATTAKYGYDSTGNRVALQSTDLGVVWDVGHSAEAFYAACDGTGEIPGTDCKMDGWNKERAIGTHPPNPQYTFVAQKDIAPYWTIAKQYVLADETFSSNLDGSFIAHQYAVAAYAGHAYDYPAGPWGCEGGKTDTIATIEKGRKIGPSIVVCFTIPTIASEADAKGVSWRFYTGGVGSDGGLWSSYQADRAIYNGPDWKTDVVNPPSQFLTDIENGKFASITWITPTDAVSDHPGADATQGPAWIASIVDAIGTSRYWNSTAIFIMWDDWGGMFDPVKPIYEDYDGLGFRVPLIMVSPYAKQGSVTHVQYETTSVLRFIEDAFGLAQLNKSDARATDPASDSAAFDFSQKPRKFKKISGSHPASYWSEL